MKNIFSAITFILIIFSVWYTFYSSMPRDISGVDTPDTEFSALRALEHVKNIAKAPHYLGNSAHQEAQNYIVEELKKLGLRPTIQEGFAIGDLGNLTKPQNIIAKIKGSEDGKALLLLSHYDSSAHSSLGASDAGSGVVTILEGVRAFIAQKKLPKNDIIICFTDAEELGLNGANLFVDEHPWAKDIGLVLNFEARGSGGNSYMFIETNDKNSNLVNEFIKANPEYPVTNSLAYSIYKLLPNDTDLTVFRKHGNIDGFNFAFIDDHFDYHTANDTWQNLDLNTLQHQGSYLMPLLSHFADADLNALKSDKDFLYFNTPIFKMVKYPFNWNYPMIGLCIVLFIILLVYARKRKRLNSAEIGSGFLALIISIGLAGVLSFGLWKLITVVYPEYQDMLHGFTYNGYYYIGAAVLLAVAVFFKVYSIFDTQEQMPSIMVAPLFLWIAICIGAVLYLPGAGYFTILVLFALLSFFVMINQKRPFAILMVLLGLPSIFILVPFISSFPVALGLEILFVSAALTVLLCVLLLPVLGYYSKKGLLGTIAFVLALICLGVSHYYSDFNEERQKPNSLVYLINEDKGKAYWASYDNVLDVWTKKHIDRLKNIAKDFDQETIESKYLSRFAYINNTELKTFPSSAIEASFDSIQDDIRYLDICIRPQRTVQRMDLFVDKNFNFKKLHANGVSPKDASYKNGKAYNAFTNRWNARLLTYHIVNNEPLELRMQFHKDSVPKIVLYESSYDLLQTEELQVEPRAKTMIPKPFVVNDAIMIKKTIDISTIKKVVDTILPITESLGTDEYAN